MNVHELPLVNASLNGAATVLIVSGLCAVKARKVTLHRVCMVAAIAVSAAFLACYLFYHFNVGTVTKFTHSGWPKTVYYVVLATHVPLAALVLPLLVLTVLPAIKDNLDAHRRWAKITFPVWLYVSVTGVLVYLMLYVWYPPAQS